MKNYSLYNDQNLFQLIAADDEAAFEELFKRYLPSVYPVVQQIVKTEFVVSDIVQDIFMIIWLSRKKLAEIIEPKRYIFRIAYNRSFKFLKRQLLETRAAEILRSEYQNDGKFILPEKSIEASETRRIIEEAIHQLPVQSRKIYLLSRVSGYKSQEIADMLGISVQSVRNSLTRSGKQIRIHLTRQGSLTVPVIIFLYLFA